MTLKGVREQFIQQGDQIPLTCLEQVKLDVELKGKSSILNSNAFITAQCNPIFLFFQY